MSNRNDLIDALFWVIAIIGIALIVALIKISRTLGVDFKTSAELVGWAIAALALIGAARWNDSRSFWEQTFFRVETVWPVALLFMWNGFFPVLRYWASDLPAILYWDGQRYGHPFEIEPLWYGADWFCNLIAGLILVGGYGINYYRRNRSY